MTETAQEGYYPVYLFDSKLDAVYLSLNQGVTSLKREVGTDAARRVLESRADVMAARLTGKFGPRFDRHSIDLQPSKSGSLLELYQHGHALGARYSRDSLPAEKELLDDLPNPAESSRERMGGSSHSLR